MFKIYYSLNKKPSLPRFSLYLLILFTVIPAHAEPKKMYPGVSDLTFTSRPSQPYENINNYNPSLTENGVGSEFTVPVSRHHIIPLSILRQFYNNVIQNPVHMIRIRSFFLTISTHLPYYAPSGAFCLTHKDDLQAAMTLSDAISHRLISHGTGRNTEGIDTFQQFIAWIPGNLFVGPTSRSDDPGNRFEDGSEVVIGTRRFLIMRRLY